VQEWSPPVEVDGHGEMAEDDDVEESEEWKKVQRVITPTRKMIEEHEDQNHAVYRNWCATCVQSRGLGQYHKKVKLKEKDEARDGPKIFCDFYFMSTDESSTPMLALKFSRSKRLAATALPQKGATSFAVKFFSNFVSQVGVGRCICHSDNESSLVALKEAVKRATPGVEMIPRTCPWGDHQANV